MTEESSTEVKEADPAAVSKASASSGLFKRKNRATNIRKRQTEEDDEETEATGKLELKKTKQVSSVLQFNTKKDVKEDLNQKYEGSRTIQDSKDSLATRVLETETEYDRDQRALREKVLKQSTEGVTSDGVYRGMNSYIDYKQGFRRENTVSGEKGSGSHGPLRGSAYVRVSARFDYQPDICKDYKETGFCSYGDSCKFLHDRGDYKSGWELEKEYEEEQKRRQEVLLRGMEAMGEEGEAGEVADEQEDEIPFACFICRRPWGECGSDPVVTRCKHYFCEKCALKRNLKNPRCAVCEEPTNGIFNIASDVQKRAKRIAAGL